jgi:hypothetical protein
MSLNSSCNVACTIVGRSAYGDSEVVPRFPAHGKTNQAQLAPRHPAHGKPDHAEDKSAHGNQEQEKADQEKADQEQTRQRHLHLHQAAQGMVALSSSFGSSSVSTGAVSSA